VGLAVTLRLTRPARRRLGERAHVRRGASSCALLAALASLAISAGCGGSSESAARARLLGPAPADERISFTLLLRLPGGDRLRRTLEAIENPRSPRFRSAIGARAFGARYGVSRGRLAALERSLARDGFKVIASYPQRTALRVSGTVASVERLLRVEIASYRDAAGRSWHAPRGAPSVPPSLARLLSGVTGLDTRPAWKPRDVPSGGLVPAQAASAYDIAPLRSLGMDGRGQTIAVISFSDFNHRDPDVFARRFGLSGPAPRVISVDGGTTDTSGADEANLDIGIIRMVAPAARILVYEAPNGAPTADVLNRIVADHSASIVSDSWGKCELYTDPAEQAADRQALAAADAAGVSMFAASGDQGAYDCQSADLSDHRLSVDWPAASGGLISVGGTRLYLDAHGSYLKESAWEGVLSNAGGGGGLSAGTPRPAWQSAPGLPDRSSNGLRALPDVSADADPATGWVTYSSGSGGDAGAYHEAGGTSAAAPFWAASMLLIDQYDLQQRVGNTGFIGPILYALASAPQPLAPFHDVTAGGNRYYQAAPGWDAASGLGSPDVNNLARDIAAYLKAHPR
jgi:subtilase family serine protease